MSLEKQAYDLGIKLGLQQFEKTAVLSRLLKPISKGYKGTALVDRVAPLGWNRFKSEFGHMLGDVATGAGVVGLLGGTGNEMAIGAGLSSFVGSQLNQVRANKYLKQALQGKNALTLDQLKLLRENMGDFSTYYGADSVHELFGGVKARNRVSDAIRKMEKGV